MASKQEERLLAAWRIRFQGCIFITAFRVPGKLESEFATVSVERFGQSCARKMLIPRGIFLHRTDMPTLNAKPEALDVEFANSAIVLVDMQNAFASKGGLLDIAGVDLADAPLVVRTVRDIILAARSAGVLVVYLRMAYKTDLSDAGGARSPNCYKELAMHTMRARPEYKGKLLTEGTWDAAIVDDLTPQSGDLVITKTRYSGFAGTTLDSQLRMRGIQFLFFAGIATNVCVESTLRDAYFLDYWPILVSDGTMPAGGPGIFEATLFNVESFFGWTVTSDELRARLKASTG